MSNAITLTGTRITSSTPSDPSMCRVSGYIRDIQGTALAGEKLRVRHVYDPVAIGSDTLVLQEQQDVQANSSGLVSFDLYQGATVQIELPNRVGDLVRECVVPSQESIDLIALLFPYIVSVAFDDGSSKDVGAGERFTLALTATLSDGTEVSVGAAASYSIEDEDVVQSTVGSYFQGVAAGVTTVEVTDIDTDELEVYQEADGDVIHRLDAPDISYPDPITITVV